MGSWNKSLLPIVFAGISLAVDVEIIFPDVMMAEFDTQR
jgi:hypothetical protein